MKFEEDIDTIRKWIEYQMTPVTNWTNNDTGLVKSISSFDLSIDEELQQAFN